MSQAILRDVFPRPVLDLDFTTGVLDSRLTFARASAAWSFDSSGLLVQASSGTPRFNCEPITGQFRGLLIEEGRTNLLLRNRDLANLAWVKLFASAATDQVGIDGAANSASLITASSSNATVTQTVVSASALRISSAFVKRLVGSGAVEMTQDGGGTWTPVVVTAGWTRVQVPAATITNPTVGFRLATSGDSIAVDAVQLESGDFVTSPILTTTSAVSRAIDNCSMTTTPPGERYSILYEGFGTPARSTFSRYHEWVNIGSTQVASFQFNSAPPLGVHSRISVEGVEQTSGPSVDVGVGLFRAAMSVALNSSASYVNGKRNENGTASLVPSGLTSLTIGNSSVGGTRCVCAEVRRFSIYDRALSASQLSRMTLV